MVYLFQVTGYVLIANVYVQNVTLENLRIIRGDTLFVPHSSSSQTTQNLTTPQVQKGYALFVSLNFMPASESIGMRLLGLKKLTGKLQEC